MREELVRMLGSKLESAKMTSQAVKAPAWVLGLVALVTTPLLLFAPFWIQVFAAIWFTAALVYTGFLIDYFRRKDPDRLGSETYLTRRHAIDVAAKDPEFARAVLSTVASDEDGPAPPHKMISDQSKRRALGDARHERDAPKEGG